MSRPLLRQRVEWARAKRWFSLSWLPLFIYAGGTIYAVSDRFLVGLLISPEVLASYGIALTIAGVLRITAFLPSALAPKILGSGTDSRDIANTYKIELMLAVPLFVGGIAAAPNLIAIFGSKFLDGLPALYVLLTREFISSFFHVYSIVIISSDKVDVAETPSLKTLVKSNLFRLHSLAYPASALLIILILVLAPGIGIVGVSLSVLAVSLLGPMVYVRIKPDILRLIPFKALVEYTLAVLPMLALLLLIPYSGTIQTLVMIGVSAATYFGTLTMISSESRQLVKASFNEIKNKVVSLTE